MSDKVGQIFGGIISGVTEWGVYVELDGNKCEGMIHIRELNDDFYYFDEDNYCIKGRRLGRILQLGEPIQVEVLRANLMKKQLDFRLADNEPVKNVKNVRTMSSKERKSKKRR